MGTQPRCVHTPIRMAHFSLSEKNIVEREHYPPKEGLSFSELKENFNRPAILPDLGVGPGVEMNFGRVEFTPNESLISVAEMEHFASPHWMGPLVFGHEWEKPKEQSREMVNSLFMKPEFSSLDHFGGEETHEKLTIEMALKPFWIPTDDDFLVEEKWKHLKEKKKKWKVVKPAWKPETSDLLEEKESQPRPMKKKSKPRSMEKESKLQPMKKEAKPRFVKKESKPQSVDKTSKLGGDLPSSEPFSLTFEEVIQFARGSAGPDLSMGPSPSPSLVNSL